MVKGTFFGSATQLKIIVSLPTKIIVSFTHRPTLASSLGVAHLFVLGVAHFWVLLILGVAHFLVFSDQDLWFGLVPPRSFLDLRSVATI